MNNEKEKLTYSIVSSTKKEGYHDIVNSNGDYIISFKKYHDCYDYIGSYLIHKEFIYSNESQQDFN
jgi:hypothetical protein